VASAGLKKVREIIDARFSPSQYNVYLFYASDGENFPSDQPQAQTALEELVGDCNYAGFLEVAPLAGAAPDSEIGRLFVEIARDEPTSARIASAARRHLERRAHFFGSSLASNHGSEDWQRTFPASSSSRASRGSTTTASSSKSCRKAS
jgi:hypothetical protein